MRAYWVAVESCKIGEIYNMGGEKIFSSRSFLELTAEKSQNAKLKLSYQSLKQVKDVTEIGKYKIMIPNLKLKLIGRSLYNARY